MYDHIHKGSINVSSQKNGYKIYSRWYRTPEKIHKYHPQVSPQCWRCDTAIGSLAHIWWDCTILQPFWQEVHCLNNDLYLRLHPSPVSAPRPYPTQPTKNHLHSTLSMRPNNVYHYTGKASIPPLLENLIHQAKETPTKYQTTWACWIHFRESTEFQTLYQSTCTPDP